jgi:SAM-dependent methyltransferase
LHVVGVDRSDFYLERVRATAQQEHMDIEFIRADIREFRRPHAFEFTSFGYFTDPDDDLDVLRNVRESLRPGGALVIDLIGKEVLARIFRERDWQESEDGSLLVEQRTIRDGWREVRNRWVVIRQGTRTEYELRLRLYSAVELTVLLSQAGFGTVEAYGSLGGAPYDTGAQRLVVVAR